MLTEDGKHLYVSWDAARHLQHFGGSVDIWILFEDFLDHQSFMFLQKN